MLESRAASGDAHLRTHLAAVDIALGGGIPTGGISELVGPAGAGKTQMCLALSAVCATPREAGGMGGGVVYIDTEQKFSGARLIEIARAKFPEVYQTNNPAAEEQLLNRVTIITPTTLTELNQRLGGLAEALIDRRVKLVVIDSMAAVARVEFGRGQLVERQGSRNRL